MNRIKHTTKLICPDSVLEVFMLASDAYFWIDINNVWNVECEVCGGQHNLDDMLDQEESPTVSPERLAEILMQCDCIGSLAPIPLWHDLAWDKYRLNIATKLLKTLDIRGKE
jgi:hypothetical protein